MIVVLLEPVRSDLADILTHIAHDNTVAALEVVDEIERFCTVTLKDNPKIGTAFQTSVGNIRMFPKTSYDILLSAQVRSH